MRAKFNHLLQLFKDVKMELDGQDVNISKALLCQLCNYKSNNVLDMIKHNKSLRHIQIEQIYCLQRRCESLESIVLGEIYKIVDGKLLIFFCGGLNFKKNFLIKFAQQISNDKLSTLSLSFIFEKSRN